MSWTHPLPQNLLRWTAALVAILSLVACSSGASMPGETPDAGASEDAGNVGDAGAPPSCMMDPGGELLSGLAEANTDETRPGRPAVAAGGDQFLVVAARIGATYMDTAVTGALVAPDHTVEKTLTIAKGPSDPIAVDVGYDGTGYLVVFTGQGGSLKGARLSADGTPVGGPIPIALDVVVGDIETPALAFGGGTYLVVYAQFTGSSTPHLFARRISTAGDVSAEIVISNAMGGQRAPAVTYDGTNFFVVWQDGRNKVSFDDTDIYAARVAPDGTVLDPGGIAVSTAAGAQMTPHAAFDGTRHVVAWFDATNTSLYGDGNIRGARVGTDGTLLDGPAAANGFPIAMGTNVKEFPRVLRFGQGTLVTWGTPGYASNGGAGIFGAHLGADGALLDDAPDANGIPLSGAPEDAARFLLPAAAAMGDRALLVWLDNAELGGQTKAVRGASLCPF